MGNDQTAKGNDYFCTPFGNQIDHTGAVNVLLKVVPPLTEEQRITTLEEQVESLWALVNELRNRIP